MAVEPFPFPVKVDGLVFCRKKNDDLVCDYTSDDPGSRYRKFGDINSIRVAPSAMNEKGILMKEDHGGIAFTIVAGSTCLKDTLGNVTCR